MNDVVSAMSARLWCTESTDEDVEFFVREGARICGISADEGKMNGDTGKELLASMFRQIVQFKVRDDMTGGGRYSGSPGGGGRAKQTLPATSLKHMLNPRFLNYMASYDVASNICRALAGGRSALDRIEDDFMGDQEMM